MSTNTSISSVGSGGPHNFLLNLKKKRCEVNPIQIQKVDIRALVFELRSVLQRRLAEKDVEAQQHKHNKGVVKRIQTDRKNAPFFDAMLRLA